MKIWELDCCNSDLVLKSRQQGRREGGRLAIALVALCLYYDTRYGCPRWLCLMFVLRHEVARISHVATGWHFLTRNQCKPSCSPRPFGTTPLEKSI